MLLLCVSAALRDTHHGTSGIPLDGGTADRADFRRGKRLAGRVGFPLKHWSIFSQSVAAMRKGRLAESGVECVAPRAFRWVLAGLLAAR